VDCEGGNGIQRLKTKMEILEPWKINQSTQQTQENKHLLNKVKELEENIIG